MDNLLATSTPIESYRGKNKNQVPSGNKAKGTGSGKPPKRFPHKTVDAGSKGMIDPTLHSLRPGTRTPSSLQTKDELRPPKSNIKDLKLRSKVAAVALAEKRAEKAREDAAMLLENQAGMIQTTAPMERTFKVSQVDIKDAAGTASAAKGFDLKLDGGNGGVVGRWTRDGRHLALATRRGHISTMNFQAAKLESEIYVNETCRDIVYLHTSAFHAVAQKKYVFIYDQDGTELHKLKDHVEPTKLGFLPYHFLLTSISQSGYLKYHDTSTGSVVQEHRTKLGGCNVMEINQHNGIVHLGHQNGTMTLWSPNMSTPHVRLLAHLGPISSVSVDPSSSSLGRYITTTGLDGSLKIWDSRNWAQPVNQWTSKREITSTSYSQRGLLAVAAGTTVSVYSPEVSRGSTARSGSGPGVFGPPPYLSNLIGGGGVKVNDVRFCPFEDVLGVGHEKGFSTLLIPGAGEPNFDSYEGDMFESTARRKEREVRAVMEKIQPELITMDESHIGSLAAPTKFTHLPRPTKPTPFSHLSRTERLRANGGLEDSDDPSASSGEEGPDGQSNASKREAKEKKRMRGRNKTVARLMRKKKKNVIDPSTIAMKAKMAKDYEVRQQAKAAKTGNAVKAEDTGALSRFGSRKD
ncbi:WD40-repeat-containing subunit of the 18S rRNA processing complex [Phaffia rhodozyma]|uniref:U three protein 7 n=1 Tax=Phaffia rhodozyma TaxID=264483 RepID=A0A0F7SUC7_PHARH|nr:WD40-repeat-containing subunit of the 18S rRNA processing complex [Phaffia rhodozyma]